MNNPHEPGTLAYDMAATGRIKTFTGKYVAPHDMTEDMLDIVDIAHALSRVCRFGGHTAGFLSVAEHCVRVSYAVPHEFALEGLLHDASEAYLGDMCRPLKKLPEMQVYRDAEARLEAVIGLRFGIPATMSPEVVKADNDRLLFEMEHLRHAHGAGLTPNNAKTIFLSRYTALTGVQIGQD